MKMTEPMEDQLALVRTLKQQNKTLDSENRNLKSGGPGGTSGGMDATDAKIAAAEARIDTKFAELKGALSQFATKNTVWGAVGTAVAIGLAVAAFGGDRFDSGMAAGAIVQPIVSAQTKRDEAQDKKLDEILSRLPAKDVVPSKK
jgi:hypothetical protein